MFVYHSALRARVTCLRHFPISTRSKPRQSFKSVDETEMAVSQVVLLCSVEDRGIVISTKERILPIIDRPIFLRYIYIYIILASLLPTPPHPPSQDSVSLLMFLLVLVRCSFFFFLFLLVVQRDLFWRRLCFVPLFPRITFEIRKSLQWSSLPLRSLELYHHWTRPSS